VPWLAQFLMVDVMHDESAEDEKERDPRRTAEPEHAFDWCCHRAKILFMSETAARVKQHDQQGRDRSAILNVPQHRCLPTELSKSGLIRSRKGRSHQGKDPVLSRTAQVPSEK
jgi:hypothetical protein